MGSAFFYHLTASPLEQTLPQLLGKAMQAGWRIAVRGTSTERIAWLDEKLWLVGGEDAFLPHGLAGGDHDVDQPVLLTTGADMPNAAQCLMAVDGAPVTAREVDGLERVCILFDGNDDNALQAARAQWKELTDAGCLAQYWAQEDGTWAKKAEGGGPAK